MGAQPSSHSQCRDDFLCAKDLTLPREELQQLTSMVFEADRRDGWRSKRTVSPIDADNFRDCLSNDSSKTVHAINHEVVSMKDAGQVTMAPSSVAVPASWSYLLQPAPLLLADPNDSKSNSHTHFASLISCLDTWPRRRQLESGLPGGVPTLSSSEQLELLLLSDSLTGIDVPTASGVSKNNGAEAHMRSESFARIGPMSGSASSIVPCLVNEAASMAAMRPATRFQYQVYL